MKKIKTKLQSKVVWLSVLAQVLMIIVVFKPEIAEPVKIVATSVIEILTLFGVLNNPSDRNNF